jgi:hypothetical protein
LCPVQFRTRTKRERERERTRIGNRHNSSASKVTCTRRTVRPLVVAVEGIRGMRLQGVREVAETGALDRTAVCHPGTAHIVQCQLDGRLIGAALRDAPRGTLYQVFYEENSEEEESNQEHFALGKGGGWGDGSVCVRREYWKGSRRNEGVMY